MIRRPPRSTLFPYTRSSDLLISDQNKPSLSRGPSSFDRLDGSMLSRAAKSRKRSEEHTSELQSPNHLVCRLLLEKKNSNAALRSCTYDLYECIARADRTSSC